MYQTARQRAAQEVRTRAQEAISTALRDGQPWTQVEVPFFEGSSQYGRHALSAVIEESFPQLKGRIGFSAERPLADFSSVVIAIGWELA